MKTLPEQFRSNGFDFRQLKRVGDVAVFEKSKPILKPSRGYEMIRSFEVVKIQSHNGYEIAERKIEPAESMPSSESWGRLGWTFTDLQSAENKFNELSKA